VDCYSVCPTYYGRKNKKGDAVKMLQVQKSGGMLRAQYEALPESEREGKYIVGTLTESDYPEFTAEYQKIIDSAMKN
jgi:2-oxoglutarate ferredoxin oxidoreductase subunit beta